jgi:predicted ATPase
LPQAIALAVRRAELEPLAAAVNLYAGPFLHGFSLPASAEFDMWMAQERQHWERRYLDALATLVDGYAAGGAYTQAIAAAQRALAVDELAEDMHRWLIQLYAASGDGAAALRQFERCVMALERELGVSPLPETRAVYDAVRAGEVPPRAGVKSHTLPTGRSSAPAASPPAAAQAAPAAPRASLPAPATPLIGRQDERAATAALLADPAVRLLTLFGAGGSGKTRLALQIARDMADQFADGALFVALAPLRDPALVLQAIGLACGLAQLSPAALTQYLRDKQLLLVLDNCEHLLDAAPRIAGLLASAPGLRVLATSRAALNVHGEHTFPVSPLPLPNLSRLPALAEVADIPAVALLLARTRALNPRFQLTADNAADLAAICVRLDGLPLAIELAAARLKVLSPQALLKRLDHRLSVLDRGPRDLPDRQRTLRAAIEWSYRLLDLHLQRLFERLAAFAGGWTLEAAEAICGSWELGDGSWELEATPSSISQLAFPILDGLQTLLDSHLITLEAETADQPRFGILETIREYALERLRARGDERMVRHRHANYFARFAELRAPGFHSAEIAAADRDYYNIRAALHWSLETGEQTLAARIAGSAFWYWDTRGLLEEAQSWIAQVLRGEAAVLYPWRGRVRAYASYLAYRRGFPAEATDLARIVADDAQTVAEDRALALRVIGLAALQADDITNARPHFERALAFAQDHGLRVEVASAQFNLGLLLLIQGELVEAESILWASYVPWEQQQHPRYTGIALITLGYIAIQRGKPEQARALLRDGLRQLMLAKDTIYLLYGLLTCAAFAAIRQRPQQAAALFGATTRHAESVHLPFIPRVLALAHTYIEQARDQSAPEVFEGALRRGRSLSLDDAVALAQSLLEEPAGK